MCFDWVFSMVNGVAWAVTEQTLSWMNGYPGSEQMEYTEREHERLAELDFERGKERLMKLINREKNE